jgi:hypothetical protein
VVSTMAAILASCIMLSWLSTTRSSATSSGGCRMGFCAQAYQVRCVGGVGVGVGVGVGGGGICNKGTEGLLLLQEFRMITAGQVP